MLQNEFLFYPDRKYMFMVEKKSLTEYSYSVKDGKSKSFPRCHLDSRVHSHALCKILTYLRQLTYAHTSIILRFLRNLFRTPSAAHYDSAPSARIPPSRTLCGGKAAFTSASTVFMLGRLYTNGILLSRGFYKKVLRFNGVTRKCEKVLDK